MNATIITGRLIQDPEVTQTQDGKTKTTFKVAVDRPFIPRGAKYPDSDFYFCVAYEKTADFIGKHFQKGRAIELILSYRQYKNKDNQTSHYFAVDRAGFVPRDAAGTKGDGGEYEPPFEPDITDDELPF